MNFSAFEIKILGLRLCAQKDGFCKLGHIERSNFKWLPCEILMYGV